MYINLIYMFSDCLLFADVKGREGEDQCVLRHSNQCVLGSCVRILLTDRCPVLPCALHNRVCVICLAPTHPLVNDPALEVFTVEFQIGKTDRTKNHTSGKFKNEYFRKICVVYTTSAWLYAEFSLNAYNTPLLLRQCLPFPYIMDETPQVNFL